jgi:hypothetical protein
MIVGLAILLILVYLALGVLVITLYVSNYAFKQPLFTSKTHIDFYMCVVTHIVFIVHAIIIWAIAIPVIHITRLINNAGRH